MKKLGHLVPYLTADGSYTLLDEDRQVHYRSQHGAQTESRYVFLGASGLLEIEGPWRVGELGFGAAVNFAETLRAFRSGKFGGTSLEYHSVDWKPVMAEHLDFHDGEAGELARRLVGRFHKEGEKRVEVQSEDGAIKVVLYAMDWRDFNFGSFRVPAFFHDPFARDVNPEAWEKETFQWASSVMEERGRLTTYSAATAVRKAMFEADLYVAVYPGPGRKREMTIASRCKEVLESIEGATLLERERYLPKGA